MVTSSIAVALFISSYSTSQAASYAFLKPRMSVYDQNIVIPEVESDDLSVSATDFREDLGLDPSFESALVEQGFNPSQIQKIFTSASIKNDYGKQPLGE